MSRELNIFNQVKPVKTNLRDGLFEGQSAYEQLMLKNERNAFKAEGITGAGMGKAGDALINRFENKQNKMLDNVAQKTDKVSDKLLNGTEEISPLGKSFIGAGADALGELPGIINNFSSKPRSAQEAAGKTLNMTASGAKIGANFGPWGAAAGAVVGFGAGVVGNAGWRGEMTEEADQEMIAKQEVDRKALIANYVKSKTSEQLTNEKNMLAQAMGYNV